MSPNQSPQVKKENIEKSHEPSKARKLEAALIISFQKSFDIQEFPTGDIVPKCKALLLCRLSARALAQVAIR